MKSWKKVFALLTCGLFVLACPVFTYLDVRRESPETPVKMDAPEPVVDVRQAEQERAEKLRSAPWQGLRFLPEAREWRFYAVAGEKRKIKLIAPFDLVRVYFLQADGHLSSTWVAEGVEIAGQGYYTAASAPVTDGDLVEVAVAGDYVYQTGVNWEACGSEYCHLAQLIDTTLILDDKGTGITNGFIRYGWQPPSHPLYGFLVWQIRPYNEDRIQVSKR